MIINIILLLLFQGWSLNTAVFAVKNGWHPSFYINYLFAASVGVLLVVRLT